MGLTKVSGDVIQGTINVGVVTATTINVGSAVTIHTGGFRVGSSDLHSSGLTVQNLNSTGVVTATSFVGNITGNVTGNATGLSGTPNITVGSITASSATITGNVSVAGTVTYDDVTNVDSLGVGTFRSGIVVNTGTASTALIVNGSSRITGILSVGQGTITINGNTDKITTPKLDYAGISSVTADNAVDVFVYDTRKDSDGGAWRKRTQHTSWYNETLNTATRGSRRDFPAVAVIVATTDDVFIYDGDDPDLPLWMKFIGSSGARAVRQGMSSITMLNGLMTAGRSGSQRAVGFVNFVSDYVYQIASNGKYEFGTGGILNRNTDGSFINVSSSTQIVGDGTVYDVAMTVLPNAPIDSATGLPTPTIAVATAGGASVIKDDGNVYDDTDTAPLGSVDFNDDYRIISTRKDTGSAAARFFISKRIDTVNSDSSWLYEYYTGNYGSPGYPRLRSEDTGAGITLGLKGDTCIRASNIGITLWDVNSSQIGVNNYSTNSLLCGVSTSFNTGWMHGDIKGAFLSDTSTASVTGTELITNGTFTSNTTGWSISDGSGTVTISSVSGQLNIVMNNNLNGYRWAYQTINSLPAGSYAISADVVSNPSNRARIRVGTTGANTTDLVDSGYLTGTGTFSVYFTTTSTQNVTLTLMSDLQTGTGVWDNVVFRKVEADRSVNNKGLQVFGTITKTAVATGADLVAYGGFITTTNYLQQPYNSSLSFGTNDFSIMCWYYNNASTEIRLNRNTGGADGWAITLGNAAGDLYIHNGNFSTFASFTGISNTGVWNHWTFIRRYNDKWYVYKNGILAGTTTTLAGTNFNDLGTFLINAPSGTSTNSISLVRVSQSVPSPDQITKIYNDEKMLFQQNSKATLYGTSSAVTALAYDDSTRLLYAGTSSGRSDFQGLERINNTTTAVTTAISASNGLVAEQ